MSDEAAGKSGELKRAQIPIRTTPAFRDRLAAAAAANGRSLTQEIEQRLERSLQMDEVRGSPESARLLDAIAVEMADVARWTEKPWWDDMFAYYATAEAISTVVQEHAPLALLNDPRAKAAVQALIEAEEIRDAAKELGTPHVTLDADVDRAQKAFDEAMEPQREARRTARRIIRTNRRILRRLQEGEL